MAFQAASEVEFSRRLIVSVDGLPFTGKTSFLLTAPQPLRVFNIDYGLEGVLEDVRSRGTDLADVAFEDYSLKKALLSKGGAIDRAREVVKQFHQSYRELLKAPGRVTIGLDTCSEFWQLYRLADLGKLEQVPPMRYVKVNRLFRDLLNEAYHTPHNLVLIHRQKDRYDSKIIETDGGGVKEVSVRIPGEVERDGFKEIDGIVQVTIETFRREKAGKPSVFGFRVKKCRQRMMLTGQRYEGEFATFGHLALDVFPESAPDEWGM